MKKRIVSLLLVLLFLCLMAQSVTALPDSFSVSPDSIGPVRVLERLPFEGVLTAPPNQREKPLAQKVMLLLIFGLLAVLLLIPKLQPCLAKKRRVMDKRSAMKRYLSHYIFGSRFRKGAFSCI